jgi:hypothetical protein
MIGFWLVNLLIPGDPGTFVIQGLHGDWEFKIAPNFTKDRASIEKGKSGYTYSVTNPASLRTGGFGPTEEAFKELVPITLACSYLTGSTVTLGAALSMSEISVMGLGDYFPRDRSTTGFAAVIDNISEFVPAAEKFVQGFGAARTGENMLVVMHFLMDALSCWSLEDLYLSLMSIFEIIKQTQRRRECNPGLSFYEGVSNAARHYGLPVLSRDFLNMRNDLTHEGTLSGSRFPGKAKADCAGVAADALNWLDQYLHAALTLGPPKKKRFNNRELEGLSAYSL